MSVLRSANTTRLVNGTVTNTTATYAPKATQRRSRHHAQFMPVEATNTLCRSDGEAAPSVCSENKALAPVGARPLRGLRDAPRDTRRGRLGEVVVDLGSPRASASGRASREGARFLGRQSRSQTALARAV